MKFKLILLLSLLFLRIGFSDSRNISNAPIKQIQEFTAIIEKNGWVSDEERINKKQIYREFNRESKKLFAGKPFYTITYENTMLNRFSDNLPSEGISIFKEVKSIWGYFYKDKNARDWITDGVIEQWEFSNEKDAQNAMEYMHKHGDRIYFNTSPYFCRINNHVIVFQSRAMAFSYKQKPVYDLFIKMYNPVLP
ncbi:hypothetical protein GCM10007424_12100 [Flavobacterium suaedae]|uniref:Uncharacterized protein n=1 Tax=Flavobacterium suaedae TaxID=1767027 RepID=A0ABQ1JNU8_9FLAO|nr:hypothetical protein [Flavobacterium suaedae]GGB73798.1 hypothetical protein GCM10007424_12100 [Flavobacterium suaedae]